MSSCFLVLLGALGNSSQLCARTVGHGMKTSTRRPTMIMRTVWTDGSKRGRCPGLPNLMVFAFTSMSLTGWRTDGSGSTGAFRGTTVHLILVHDFGPNKWEPMHEQFLFRALGESAYKSSSRRSGGRPKESMCVQWVQISDEAKRSSSNDGKFSFMYSGLFTRRSGAITKSLPPQIGQITSSPRAWNRPSPWELTVALAAPASLLKKDANVFAPEEGSNRSAGS